MEKTISLERYNVTYEDGILIITKGTEIITTTYEPELEMVEDVINELCEEGILPINIDYIL